jgi:hypothetical protein
VATVTTLFIVPISYSFLRRHDTAPVDDSDLYMAEDEGGSGQADPAASGAQRNGNGSNGHASGNGNGSGDGRRTGTATTLGESQATA